MKAIKAPNYNAQITNKFQIFTLLNPRSAGAAVGGIQQGEYSMFKPFEILNFGHRDLFEI
jgi:hypothetical protein